MIKEPPTHPQRLFSTPIVLISFIILQGLVIGTSFLGGYLFRDFQFGGSFSLRDPFPLLSEAYTLLRDNAYFNLPPQKQLEYGMIRGMLQAYNEPFTVFVDPPHHELQTQELQGKYGGIGVRIERDAQNLAYLYPLPDSPAFQAGIRDGDRLIQVDTLIITPQATNDEIQAAIRGPVGGKVRIIIGHSPEYSPVEVTVERAEVPQPSSTWNLAPNEPRVGIIHIHVIADTTPAEVTKAIKELQQRGAVYFVIDVRNNGGGLVESGVNTARLFLKEGIVIDEQYRGQSVKSFPVKKPGEFDRLPVVFLVNKGTASAAEILAGAVQGQKRALLVGTRTYGKDTIQLVFNLSDGSSLHVTSARWWVPGLSEKITGNGLQPDVTVPENAPENQDLLTAIETVLKDSRSKR